MPTPSQILFGEAPEAVIEDKDILQDFQLDALRDFLSSTGSALEGLPGFEDLTTPKTKTQEDLFSQIIGKGATADANLSTVLETLIGDLIQPTSGSVFDESVRDPLLQQFQETIQPAISRRFGDRFFGSERRLADERSREDLLDALVQGRAQFTLDDRSNRISAAGQVPGFERTRSDIFSTLLSGAEGERQITAEGKDKNANLRLALLQQLLSGSATPTKEVVGISKGGSSGLIQGAASGAGAAVTQQALTGGFSF